MTETTPLPQHAQIVMHSRKHSHEHNTQEAEHGWRLQSKTGQIIDTWRGQRTFSRTWLRWLSRLLFFTAVIIQCVHFVQTGIKVWSSLQQLQNKWNQPQRCRACLMFRCILQRPVCLLSFRFTVVVSFRTSLMATTSTRATGCAMLTQPALWLNRT